MYKLNHHDNKYICTNCGENGHNFKKCNQPVTSFGVIAIYIPEIYNQQKFIGVESINILEKYKDSNGIICTGEKGLEKAVNIKNDIKFLLIMRKHTLGLMEFIRGRYKVDRVDHIGYLFRQMTPTEIALIDKSSFDQLWDFCWSGERKPSSYHHIPNEYTYSRDKFEELKKSNDAINLKYFVDHTKSICDQPEWGFPKGRRSIDEPEIFCAKREFEEETNLTKEDYTILENVQPLVEDIIGTNGVKYKHKYFLALLHTKKQIQIESNNFNQFKEIGNIGLFNTDESLNKIREYHEMRRKIIYYIYLFIVDTLLIKKNKVLKV